MTRGFKITSNPPKAFIFSAVIFTVVGILSTVKNVCPTCDGSGILPPAQGLIVERTTSQMIEFRHFGVECFGIWGIFTYDVDMLVTNVKTTSNHVYLIIDLYAPEASSPSIRIPVYVEIPGQTTKIVNTTVTYSGWVTEAGYGDPYVRNPQPHRIEAEAEGSLVCPDCQGKGKVPFTEWLGLILK